MIIHLFRTDQTLVNLSKRYRAWYTTGGAHGFPSRRFAAGTPGSGREFFEFHRAIMNEFFAWNNVHRAVPANEIAAWTSIPPELKVPETGWPNPWPGLELVVSSVRIEANTPPFLNDDDLGIFVESTVFNWIHGATAGAPAFQLDLAEQKTISGLQSIESTWFYKIHGLADLWWVRFLYPKSQLKEINDISVTPFKEIVDHPRAVKTEFKEIVDHPPPKTEFKEISDSPRPPKPNLKEISDQPKTQLKEISDVSGTGPYGDPEALINIFERVKQLEGRLKIKKSPFIRPFQRPNVGASIMKAKDKKKE